MIVSTPHGMNMFYKMWMDANNKKMIIYLLKYIGQKCQVVMRHGKNKQ